MAKKKAKKKAKKGKGLTKKQVMAATDNRVARANLGLPFDAMVVPEEIVKEAIAIKKQMISDVDERANANMISLEDEQYEDELPSGWPTSLVDHRVMRVTSEGAEAMRAAALRKAKGKPVKKAPTRKRK